MQFFSFQIQSSFLWCLLGHLWCSPWFWSPYTVHPMTLGRWLDCTDSLESSPVLPQTGLQSSSVPALEVLGVHNLPKQHLAHWVFQTIALTYGAAKATPSGERGEGVMTHSTRGMATSWNFSTGLLLKTFMWQVEPLLDPVDLDILCGLTRRPEC